MSLTFLPKSSAYSWKMSFDGHVLWKRMLIGPCALTTLGAVTAAAVVAPAASRNLRRVAVLESDLLAHESSPPRVDFGAALTAALLRSHVTSGGSVLFRRIEAIVLPAWLCFTSPWGSRKAPIRPI